jgi:N-acetylmuramoyl-L-alanine amidase
MALKKIMIDPGHGGRDTGAIGPTGAQEKAINMAIANKLAGVLSELAEVRLTRAEDVALGPDVSSDLQGRSKLANNWGADVFVSVHCNSAKDRKVNGTETYAYINSIKGLVLANAVQKRLISAIGLVNRGIKQANFAVLRETTCPACLIEVAFISNAREEALLISPAFQEKAARAIAEGVAGYLGLKLPESTSPDPIAEAIEVLLEAGVISSPDYWLQNARPGKTVSGENAGALIQKMAQKLKK